MRSRALQGRPRAVQFGVRVVRQLSQPTVSVVGGWSFGEQGADVTEIRLVVSFGVPVRISDVLICVRIQAGELAWAWEVVMLLQEGEGVSVCERVRAIGKGSRQRGVTSRSRTTGQPPERKDTDGLA